MTDPTIQARLGNAADALARIDAPARASAAEPGPRWWQTFGNAAQIASALIAIGGFAAILFQINEVRSNARGASARQVYLAYQDLEFRYPQFAVPDYAALKAGDRDTLLRYESFVSYLLYACEEALAAFKQAKPWRASCSYDIRHHLPFLCEKSVSDPEFLETFDMHTQEFVRTAMARAGVTPPACQLRKT
jgi:hypothetical protein